MVEVLNVHKNFKKREILKGVSFTAKPGECVGIVGGNGCGKTTLFSVMAGILKAGKGSVRYFGTEAIGNPKAAVKYTAYVPQENPIIDELSVRDNLRLWYRGSKEQMESDLKNGPASMLGIREMLTMQAGKISGGMKKRLSIACALSNHAPVLILDEPGAALDLECKEMIRNYLEQYRKSGGCVLLASHEMEELALCTRMYVLKDGILQEIPVGLSANELVARFV